MGAEIDRLEVQIETKATKVNNSLDTLVTKLEKVSGALSHLNSSGLSSLSDGVTKFAQASAQLSNVRTADFTRLAKNIEKLSALNTQQLYGASHAMRTLANSMNSLGSVSASSTGIVELANSIGKLGGVNVQRAITNLPLLATAMSDLMTTLSRAPQVSSNVIQMTRALADLASQGNRVGTAGSSIVRSMNSTGSAMASNAKKAWNLSSAIGSIYQKYFWIRRIGSKLWSSIEKSMNYVETLNYFDKAFEQVADSAVSQMGEAGAEAAEAYYESFSSRAKELTSKMTGFNVNDDGTLTATGEASLGIDPSKLMNYQATFAQMSNSMGVSAETSLLLSQALTEIGADLASVKNMDFDKVWTDMASGLAGMSRTLDKYGVNIRNVNLQQKLFELGINENITNLNQNDKALLRTIILLDSTRYAWGDLAETINQPANQMRLLESNISNLSRTFGNLFLPALNSVLPVVNGLVIALQRLFTWIGNLMGIDLSKITSTVGSSEIDMSELLGETDDLTEGLDSASDAAKKLKSNLQGFDELNVITTSDNSKSGVGVGLTDGLLDDAFIEAYSEYQKVWDEAFAKMENRANEFADKIGEIFAPISEPFKRMLINLKFDGWTQAGESLSDMAVGFYNLLIGALESVDWESVGHNIGLFLKGIEWIEVIKAGFELKFDIAKTIAEAWFSSFKVAPIETALITVLAGAKFLGLGGILGSRISSQLRSHSFTSAITGALASMGGIAGLLTMDFGTVMMAGTLAEKGLWMGTAIIGGITAAIGGFSLGQWLNEAITGEEIDMSWSEQFQTIKESFTDGSWKEALDLWGADIENTFRFAYKAQDEWYNDHVEPLLDKAGHAITDFWETYITKPFSMWGDDLANWWDNDVAPWFTLEKWSDLLSEPISAFKNFWEDVTGWLDEIEKSWNNLFGEKTGVMGGAASIVIDGGGGLRRSIQAYATGGFPEDGLFYANHNELVGQFSNGKTAVANNEQIVDGIKYGVREAVAEALIPYLADIAQNTRETANKDFSISNDVIGRGARQYARDYYKRTGQPAF